MVMYQPDVALKDEEELRTKVKGEKDATVEVRPVGTSSSAASGGENCYPEPHWRPGVKARFPWLGFSALMTVLIMALMAILILVLSDKEAESTWPQTRVHYKTYSRVIALPAPNVLLAAVNTVANISLVVAIGQGVAIAWWRKALRGATVNELHNSWSFSTSVLSLFTGIKYFNVVALAALAAKVSIVDSILLQRATSTYYDNDPKINVTIGSSMVHRFPITGVAANGLAVSESLEFSSIVVSSWQTSEFGTVGNGDSYFPGCNGACATNVEGIGFAYSCTSETVLADYGAHITGNTSASFPVFNTSFSMNWAREGKEYASIIFQNSYLQSAIGTGIVLPTPTLKDSCNGDLVQTMCELRPALVELDITVFNYTSPDAGSGTEILLAHNLDPVATVDDIRVFNSEKDQIQGWKVKQLLDIHENADTVNTTLGGIQLALQQYLGSSANVTWDAESGWLLSQEGWFATNNVDATNYATPPGPGMCNFYDPHSVAAVAWSANQLLFMLNMFTPGDPVLSGSSNSDTIYDPNSEPLQALQMSYGIHYKTHFGFMAGAVASMIVCVCLVLPSYYGYWELGRKVTLGPFEIANAFRAPILDHPAASNGMVDDLLREVGDRRVQYGEMTVQPQGRLAMAAPEVVKKVHTGHSGGVH